MLGLSVLLHFPLNAQGYEEIAVTNGGKISGFVRVEGKFSNLHTAHAYMPEGQPDFNVGLYPSRISRKPLVSPGISR